MNAPRKENCRKEKVRKGGERQKVERDAETVFCDDLKIFHSIKSLISSCIGLSVIVVAIVSNYSTAHAAISLA